jgi:hypothetical protein
MRWCILTLGNMKKLFALLVLLPVLASAQGWLTTNNVRGFSAQWFAGDGSGLTNIQGNNIVNLPGSAFSFAITNTPTLTNIILNCGLAVYKTITATNDICFTAATNQGACSVKIWPGGANRTISVPSSWVMLSTNGLTLNGTWWTLTLTNGARVAWLSAVNDGDGTYQTNVTASLICSP